MWVGNYWPIGNPGVKDLSGQMYRCVSYVDYVGGKLRTDGVINKIVNWICVSICRYDILNRRKQLKNNLDNAFEESVAKI